MALRPALVALAIVVPALVHADALVSAAYFPLRVGNWWAYEEEDARGHRLARETWNVVGADEGEFHLRSYAKRLDGLRRRGQRFEGHEYLRAARDGLRKRYPAGREPEVEVTLLKEPPDPGARWDDAQGRCEIVSKRASCAGPGRELADCVTIVCTLGEPPATIVVSTYARGVGMVRQEVDVFQILPANDPSAVSSLAGAGDGHSVLRLIAFNVR